MFHLRAAKSLQWNILISERAVSDVLGLFNSLVTKPFIFIKTSDCIIICIFIENGQKLIPAKRNSAEKTWALV